MLVVMSGAPGAGKSAIARGIGRTLGAPVISVDPVEAALWRAGIDRTQPTGLAAYTVVEAVAEEVLTGGLPVVVDAVNAVEPARAMWQDLGARHGIRVEPVKVVCSDPGVHRRRLEHRSRGIVGFPEPTWEDVLALEYEPWDVFTVDTVRPLDECVEQAVRHLRAGPRP